VLIDADAHIEVRPADVAPFVDPVWRPYVERPSESIFPHDVGDLRVGGRIQRPVPAEGGGAPAGAGSPETSAEIPDPIGADLKVVFPTQILGIGLHPSGSLEAALALGYARWLTASYLPAHPEARGMLYLPIADVEACRRVVAACGAAPGVVGAFVTNAGFAQMTDNRYMDLYADLVERGLALGFHPLSVWREAPFDLFDRYLPVWAMGQPFTQCSHLINWLVHGMPERFPELRCVFYEAGVAWLTFLAHRFDQEFLRRPVEAPLLRERPSHYLRRYFYSTQPLDRALDPLALELPMRQIGADRFLYASNYPQWDFDVPGVIDSLGFLGAGERQAILGGNARQAFHLDIDRQTGPARAASATERGGAG
jgi:predicted TIM-barrel fold metal-dependent hydrolase